MFNVIDSSDLDRMERKEIEQMVRCRMASLGLSSEDYSMLFSWSLVCLRITLGPSWYFFDFLSEDYNKPFVVFFYLLSEYYSRPFVVFLISCPRIMDYNKLFVVFFDLLSEDYSKPFVVFLIFRPKITASSL